MVNKERRITPYSIFMHKTYLNDRKRREKIEREELTIIPVHVHYANSNYEKKETGGEMRMNALLQTLDLLDRVGYCRSSQQREFHSYFIASILDKIYEKELQQNFKTIMKQLNLQKIRSDVIVCTPRRYGKTYGVALFCAAAIWALPDMTICIYSTGKRASKAMLVLIWKMIVAIAGSPEPIKVYNLQDCELQVRNMWGTMGKVSSYPSKEEIDAIHTHIHIFFLSIAHCMQTEDGRTDGTDNFLLLLFHFKQFFDLGNMFRIKTNRHSITRILFHCNF